jgi:hypothetical protein
MKDDEYGYLTAAHAFRAADLMAASSIGWDSESSNTDDSDSEYNEVEFDELSRHSKSLSASMSSSTTNESFEASTSRRLSTSHIEAVSSSHLSLTSSDDTVARENKVPSIFVDRGMCVNRSGLEILGYWCWSSSSTANQDWALVHVTNERVKEALWEQSQTASIQLNGVALRPRRGDVEVHTTWGRMTGSLSEVPILMRMPGNTKVAEVYQFTYNGSLGMADCGSLVVDSITKEIHGHVVAGAENSRTGYMMAASSTLVEVEENDGWHLMDFSFPERGGQIPVLAESFPESVEATLQCNTPLRSKYIFRPTSKLLQDSFE